MKSKTLLDAMYANDLQTFNTLLPIAEPKQRNEALMLAAGLGKTQLVISIRLILSDPFTQY